MVQVKGNPLQPIDLHAKENKSLNLYHWLVKVLDFGFLFVRGDNRNIFQMAVHVLKNLHIFYACYLALTLKANLNSLFVNAE